MVLTLTFIGALTPLLILFLVVVSSKRSNASSVISLGKFILAGGALSVISLLVLSYFNQYETSFTLIGLLRFDALSIVMFLMVSVIGFIVLQFSKSYLHGDINHLKFIRRLLLTIACVQVLVLSGNLFILFISWVSTSFSLQRLILFYKDRKTAQIAVRKKFIVARMSDLSLLIAVILLYFEYGTSNLEVIFQELKNVNSVRTSWITELSGFFIVLSAIIKSVQIPFHGWILDVMEAPTPVSGLLHAGLLNAGPFLIIRFSYLIELTFIAPIILLVIGGISALYGTIVFPKQPAIKTSLAYSSIGHMGFSLMICGMGLYSASLLHLIAHSFYKAHSFLSSGSVIDKYRLKQLKGTQQSKISIWAVYPWCCRYSSRILHCHFIIWKSAFRELPNVDFECHNRRRSFIFYGEGINRQEWL